MNPDTWNLASPWKTGVFTSALGYRIRYGSWQCSEGLPEKVLLFVNGRNEFIEKYNFLAGVLCRQTRVRFVTWDHPGQGGSGGQRSHIGSFDEFAFVAREVQRLQTPPGVPLQILAHSMGGLVALLACHRGYFYPESLLLSSPFLGMPENFVNRFLARFLALALCGAGLGQKYLRREGVLAKEEFSDNQRTHDLVRFYRLLASPWPGCSVTFGWVRAALKALDSVKSEEFSRRFQTPVHLWMAGKEAVVSTEAMHSWARGLNAIRPGQVTVREVSGARHELLYEEKNLFHPLAEEIRELAFSGLSAGGRISRSKTKAR